MLEIRSVNLDTGSYLTMTLEKALAKAERNKKDVYLKACLKRRRYFMPMFYSANGISGLETLSAQKRLATLLRYKLKQVYYELCGFVRAIMSLVIVRSSSLLLHGTQDKEFHIRQRPELLDGAVKALIVPWRAYRAGWKTRSTVRQVDSTRRSQRIAGAEYE